MPNRRPSCAVAVLLTALSTEVAGACPVDSPYYLCENLREESLAAEPEAARRRADELRRALAKRPTADQYEELAKLLEVLGWTDDSLGAERQALVARWAERFPDDPRATLARIGPFDFGAGDAAALERLAARFPDSVAVVEARVDQLLDTDGGAPVARAEVEALVARRPDDLDALHLLFELEWSARRTGRAVALAQRWRERAPGDPSALLHALVAESSRLSAAELDLRTDELFAATDEVRWRLALCERLPPLREGRCFEKLLAEWSFARATPAERQRLVPQLAEARRWDELRAIVGAERDPERADALRETIRVFASFDDEAADACDLPADLIGPLPEDERDEWIALCGSETEKVALAMRILDGGELESEERWTLQSLAATAGVGALLNARLARQPTRGDLWEIVVDQAKRFGTGDERELVEAWWRSAPDDLDALDRMAEIERETGDPRFALQLLTELYERSPSCGRAHRAEEIVEFHLAQKDAASVLRFADALAAEGGVLEEVARLARTRAALAAGDSDGALAELRQAPFAEREQAAAELELEILVARGELDEVAARLSAPAHGRTPSAFEVGERALEIGAHALARRTFEEVLRADEAAPEAWAGLGRALAAGGERQAAERALRRALELRFDDYQTFGALVELLGANGRHAEVAALVAPGDRLTPLGTGELAAAAKAALAAGERSAAERIARQLEFVDPSSAEAKSVAQELSAGALR